jgi:hypothetical protein
LVDFLLGLGLLVADLLLQGGEGGGVVEFGEVLIAERINGISYVIFLNFSTNV